MPITLSREQFIKRYGREQYNRLFGERPVIGQSSLVPQTPKKEGFFQRAKSALGERVGQIKETFSETARGDISPIESSLRVVGDVAGSLGDVIGAAAEPAIKPIVQSIGRTELGKTAFSKIAEGQDAYNAWKSENDTHRRIAESLEAVVNIADLFGAGLGAKAAGTAVKKGISSSTEAVIGAGKAFKEVGELGLEKASKTGAGRLAADIADRIPRTVERARETASEAAQRAKLISESPEPLGNAVKANLDSRIISTVTDADKTTASAYKEILDIAEESTKKIGVSKRPEFVAGEAAAKQFDLIEQQRKQIGKKIGEVTKALSKDTKTPISDSIFFLEKRLADQGISIKNGRLNFDGTGFSKAEQGKIKELYSAAIDGGEELTPYQIYKKDQLFGKLSREAKFENLGSIFIDTPQGEKSIFQVFRDVFSEKLDSYQEIKELNTQYRKLRTTVDDIQNTILRGGKTEISKNISLSEFAKTNLRRILGDAQSAAEFKGVVDAMDSMSRSLGYFGPKPEDLISFATEIRKIFPETVPATSFSGGIQTGLKGVLEGVLKAGKPNFKDQQKALKELLDYIITSKPNI